MDLGCQCKKMKSYNCHKITEINTYMFWDWERSKLTQVQKPQEKWWTQKNCDFCMTEKQMKRQSTNWKNICIKENEALVIHKCFYKIEKRAISKYKVTHGCTHNTADVKTHRCSAHSFINPIYWLSTLFQHYRKHCMYR